jgi:hypothetical protein
VTTTVSCWPMLIKTNQSKSNKPHQIQPFLIINHLIILSHKNCAHLRKSELWTFGKKEQRHTANQARKSAGHQEEPPWFVCQIKHRQHEPPLLIDDQPRHHGQRKTARAKQHRGHHHRPRPVLVAQELAEVRENDAGRAGNAQAIQEPEQHDLPEVHGEARHDARDECRQRCDNECLTTTVGIREKTPRV